MSDQLPTDETATEPRDRPRTGIILGFLLGGAFLIGLSMFANGRRGIEAKPVPAREIITRDTTVANPVRLVFVTPAALTFTHMGWMADDMHLHVIVDSVDIMAGEREIQPIAGDTFAWTLPPVAAGTHRIRLFWSDARHAPVGDTTVATLTVR